MSNYFSKIQKWGNPLFDTNLYISLSETKASPNANTPNKNSPPLWRERHTCYSLVCVKFGDFPIQE